MAAAAFASTLFNDPFKWTSIDLDHIILTGEKYYRDCLANMEPTKINNGFIDPFDLELDLTINDEQLTITPAVLACADGLFTTENLKIGMTAFENMNHNLAILTTINESYGLIKCVDPVDTTYKYVFFDSHGRDENGIHVNPEADGSSRGKVAILIFDSKEKFLEFIVDPDASHTTFTLVPIFVAKKIDQPDQSVDHEVEDDSYEAEAVPESYDTVNPSTLSLMAHQTTSLSIGDFIQATNLLPTITHTHLSQQKQVNFNQLLATIPRFK